MTSRSEPAGQPRPTVPQVNHVGEMFFWSSLTWLEMHTKYMRHIVPAVIEPGTVLDLNGPHDDRQRHQP